MNLGRAKVLEKLIRERAYRSVLELGLWDGRTASYVLEHCPTIEKYVGIDHFKVGPNDDVTKWSQADHDKHRAACEKLAEKDPRFELRIGNTSEEDYSQRFDVCFIDADHSYEGVKADIEAWLPQINQGGVLSGHDIDWPGVKRAVEELKLPYTKHADNVWMIDVGARAPLSVLCVWKESDEFSRDYVQHLAEGLYRHLHRPYQFYCLADRDPLVAQCKWIPLKHDWPAHYAKAEMWRPDLERLGRILYIDLSSVICGDLRPIADYEGEACTVLDFNTATPSQSVINFAPGWGREIYEKFAANPDYWIARGQRMIAPDFHDQVLMNIKKPRDFFSRQHIVSWKKHCARYNRAPDDARIVKFHGRPRPHKVEWAQNMWGGEMLEMTRGVVGEGLLDAEERNFEENIRYTMTLGLPEFQAVETPHDRTLAICGSGPSLGEALPWLKSEPGLVICALNGALKYLVDRSITPWCQVVLDALPRVLRHVYPVDGVTYFIASQCHPDIWDRCGERTYVWHAHGAATERLTEGKDFTFPCTIGGGGTVGVRALNLGYMLGFRKFVLVGMDSCYVGGHDHVHADSSVETFSVMCGGREFVVNDSWARQAIDFKDQTSRHDYGEISVFGDGLLAQIARESGKLSTMLQKVRHG